MHYTTPVILIVCVLIFFLYYNRSRKVVKKIRQMSSPEKFRLLNKLTAPFGLSLDSSQGILTTRTDPWQKKFGCGEFYDRGALAMQMVFDREPVYFNHRGKTWLVDLWKGQYGISTGAEAGIYHSFSIVPPSLRQQTTFQVLGEEEMLPIGLRLTNSGTPLFTLEQTHWLLGGFVPGTCTLPEDLTLEVTLAFPEESVSLAFIQALMTLGYKKEDILTYDKTVQFSFTKPKSTPSITWDSWLQSYVLWKGELFCRLYTWITRPFSDTQDRLLYMYLLLPLICPRILSIRRMKKRYRRGT